MASTAALKFADNFFFGPGSWIYGIKTREFFIKGASEVGESDSKLKGIAKTVFNASIRMSTSSMPFLPGVFRYIGFPYTFYYGAISNVGLACLKGYKAVANKDVTKGKEALAHLGFAALDCFGLRALDSFGLRVFDKKITGTLAVVSSLLYTAAGVITDLTKKTKKIHDWMFPKIVTAEESQLESVNKQLIETQSALKLLTAENSGLESRVHVLSTEYEALKVRFVNLNQDLLQTQKRESDFRQQSSQIQNEQSRLKQIIENLTEENQNLRREKDTEQNKFNRVQAELSDAVETRRIIEEKLKASESQSQSEIDKLKNALQLAEKNIEKSGQKYNALEVSTYEKQTKIDQQAEEIKVLKEKISKLNEENFIIKGKYTLATSKIKTLENEIQTLKETNRRLQTDIEQLRRRSRSNQNNELLRLLPPGLETRTRGRTRTSNPCR